MIEKILNLVLTNGAIYTVNKNNPWAQAIVIQGEEIAFVGSNEGSKSLIRIKIPVNIID